MGPRQKWQPVERNRDGIQHAELRRDLDPRYEALHDQLSDAYYNHWRWDESCPWQGYDVQTTPAETKVLFDRLHASIFLHRDLAFHAANVQQPVEKQIPLDEYSPAVEFTEGEKTRTLRKHERAAELIAEMERNGIRITVR